MKLPEIRHNGAVVSEYINYLELQDKKPKTIENKVWGINPFLQYINEKDIHDVNKSDIEHFMIDLKKSGKAVTSIHAYTFSLRYFFKWLIPGNNFFENVKVKRPKIDHSKDEYVNIEDVKSMLKVCTHQRDRAFFFCLWESAARLEEILNINIEDLKPTKDGIIVHLNGKTGERDVLLIDSMPDLLSWLNLQKGEKGPLFTTTTGARLSHTGAQSLIGRVAKKAGIKGKKFNAHAFRHGRLTELANMGMTEMQLRLFAGWQDDSDMPSTYIHTKKKDVFNKLRKLKGIEPEEPETVTKATTPKKCPGCGTENPFDAVACYKCRAVLDTRLAVEIANRENEQKREIEVLRKEIEELKRLQMENSTLRPKVEKTTNERLEKIMGKFPNPGKLEIKTVNPVELTEDEKRYRANDDKIKQIKTRTLDRLLEI